MNKIGLGPKSLFLLSITLFLWIASVVATGAGVNLFSVSWDFSNSGAFGDSFGPLSAVMASIAAVSAIATYRVQSGEMARLQERQAREDLLRERQRADSERRQQELDRRAQKSSFEDTFFKLLDSFRNITSQIDIKSRDGRTSAAHDAFAAILKYTESEIYACDGSFAAAWSSTVIKYKNDLNHYFRFLYHVIKFIDESEFDSKILYVRLVRAMLSEAEIVLIGLNCEHGEGNPNFLGLIQKYALLHNMSDESKRKFFSKTEISADAFGAID